jgi:hypothetical protein
MLDNPAVVILGACGVIINLLFSGGTLYKLIEFANDYGAVKEKVRAHGEEIERLRDFSHALKDGKIPIKFHSAD